MKTHQEIHDAIKHLPLQAGSHYSTDKWAEVLHALNDRIKDVDGCVKAAFTAIEVLDSSKAPRE